MSADLSMSFRGLSFWEANFVKLIDIVVVGTNYLLFPIGKVQSLDGAE